MRDECSLVFAHEYFYQGMNNKLFLFTVVFSRIDMEKILLL